MARRKVKQEAEFVLFDVLYEDGTRRSNRRVPGALLGGLDGDEPARALIEEQDRELGQVSGQKRPHITSVTRSSGR